MKRLTTYILIGMLLLGMLPSAVLAKGPGGGDETTAANNLSFPVIWSTTTTLLLNGTESQASLTVPYTEANPCPANHLPYAQKQEGNVWQAENDFSINAVVVNGIDWGDSLESVNMRVGRPVRIEATLYKDLDVPMMGYNMVMLANPSSPDEVQGVCAEQLGIEIDGVIDNGSYTDIYSSTQATVYTPNFGLVIQKIIAGTTYTWDSITHKWLDAGLPVNPIFAGELNVGGKVIYGLAEGGWRPSDTGIYRITFYLTGSSDTSFEAGTTLIVNPGGSAGVTAIDYTNQLTYVDITVVSGGGGGH